MTILLTRAALCILAFALSVVGASGGQVAQPRGSIVGTVVLADGGAPAAGATVILVNAQRETRTDEDGRFVLADLPPGTYEVFAQREQLGASRQTVTVSASAEAH